MALELWSSKRLFRRLRDERMDAIPSYFLDTFYGAPHFSSDKEILISELPSAGRKLAPFVLPTEQGKPLAEFKGETVKSLLPAYIKPKDAVRPEDARNVYPDEVFSDVPLTLVQQFNRRVGDIQNQHVRAIKMTIAWMAARAVIDGKVVIKYQRDQGAAHPEVTIDFGRAANQTVVLNTTFWSDPDYPILDDIQLWADRMAASRYGAFPTELLLGYQVAPWFRKNKQVRAELDTQRRGTAVNMQTGVVNVAPQGKSWIASLGSGIEVYAYRDYVENSNGDLVDILNGKDVLLTAPGLDGVPAYGAIYDVDAIQSGSVAIDIFPKMFKTDDPGELYVMHQSAPLPIITKPNRSLKATVLN